MATIHDVAKLAGVSTATVSRSFGDTQLLNSETKERVLDVARSLNYSPRRSATRIKPLSHQGKAIQGTAVGFQFFAQTPNDTLPTNGFYGPILAGAQAEADALGMHLLLHTTHRHKLTQELPNMIREQAVAAMLLVGTADPEILQSFLQYVPHIVLVDNKDTTGLHDCILSDGFGGAFAATKHLLDMGHRRIGFLTSRVPEVTLEDRLNGYLCAHFRAAAPVDPKMIMSVTPVGETSEAFVSVREIIEHLHRPSRPTAVVGANDAHALGLLVACRRLNISVPGEMSVIGFDDIDLSAHAYPGLSTMRVDKEQLGRAGVRRLFMRIQAAQKQRDPEPPLTIELPVALIERQSCAPPKDPSGS